MPRIVRSSIKVVPLIFLILFLGGAVGFPDAPPAQERALKVIDTSGPVEMSKCEPCHRDLNNLDNNPTLINFNHPVHFKRDIECPVCHVVFPHQPGRLIKPTMDLCANCHRQQHGNQGQTAPSQCGLCHPAGFKLTPDDHERSGFSGAGHAGRARLDEQPCLVCHTGNTCKACHEDKDVQTTTQFRWYGVWPTVEGKGEKIRVGGKVDMAACQACHRDLQQWKNSKLVNFSHPPHFKRNIDCSKCHDEWPHLPGEIRRPQMAACAQCHRLDHGGQGRLVAAESPDSSAYCFLCHPKTMELTPDWHTVDFVGGDHKRFAKRDRGLCRMCHLQQFCDSCHQTEIPHGVDWPSEHGRVAASLQDQGDNLFCFECHATEGPQTKYQQAPSCAKCHKAVVFPHPKPWAPVHGKTAGREGIDVCETCHVKQNFCDKCHGGVPLPHGENWIGKHRVFLQDNDIDVCLVCHKQGQCEQCHSIHKVHRQYKIYLPRTEPF